MDNLNDFILNAPIKVKRYKTKYDEYDILINPYAWFLDENNDVIATCSKLNLGNKNVLLFG